MTELWLNFLKEHPILGTIQIVFFLLLAIIVFGWPF